MSHIGTVECFVTDLGDVRAALAHLPGLELVENRSSYKSYYGQSGNGRDGATCEHVIRRVDGKGYEIGIIRRLDGAPGWELQYDSWSSGGAALHEIAGVGLATLKDEIAAATSMRILQRKGYRIARTRNAAGELQLRATR